MEAKDLRKKPKKELKNLLAQKREELLDLRSKNEMGHLKQTHQLKEVKRDVARIATTLKNKKETTTN